MLLTSSVATTVCFLCMQKLYTFFTFRIFTLAVMPSSVLLLHLCKISGPVFLYSKRYTDEFISKNYSLLI